MGNDRRSKSSDELIRQAKETLQASTPEFLEGSPETDLPDVPGDSTLVTRGVERPTIELRTNRRPSPKWLLTNSPRAGKSSV